MTTFQWIIIGFSAAVALVLIIFHHTAWVKKFWKIIAAVLTILVTIAVALSKKKMDVSVAPPIIPQPEPNPPVIPKPDSTNVIAPVPIVVIGVDYQLSPHFSFGTMTRTDHREFLDKNRNLGKQYLDNLKKLCNGILEPIWELIGTVYISSGFRCTDLNTVIGGSKTSQHCYGEAADTEYANYSVKDAFNKIAFSDISYAQIIFEFGSWVHISLIDEVLYPGKVGQKLVASRENGKTVYTVVTKPI